MHPPPQWLLAHNSVALEDNDVFRPRRQKGSNRPWAIFGFSCLWGCLVVIAQRRLELSGYLQTLKSVGAATATKRTMQTRDATLYQQSRHDDYSLVQESQYFLNDPTMRLSPYVRRPWLNYHTSISEAHTNVTRRLRVEKPKRKLVLTDFGWNHPDPKHGLTKFPRSLRMRELLQAFIDHPDFDPTFSWSDMLNGTSIDTSLQYVVMMDVETCFESNYPYNVGEFSPNADTQQNRIVTDKYDNPCLDILTCSPYINEVLGSRLFKAVNSSTLMYLDCRGFGPNSNFRQIQPSRQISILSMSSGPGLLSEDTDFGMPPPAVHPLTLSRQQRRAIQTCDSESSLHRPHLFTFLGRSRVDSPRDALFKLHNGNDVLLFETDSFYQQKDAGDLKETYESLLARALFAAAPRGDNLFSYRFTEVLSAGAIPVVHSDGWVLPYHKELVDWSNCAVIIPEAELDQTIDILRRIDPEKRCQMRQYCYDIIYEKYMVNPEANLAGILASIDASRISPQ